MSDAGAPPPPSGPPPSGPPPSGPPPSGPPPQGPPPGWTPPPGRQPRRRNPLPFLIGGGVVVVLVIVVVLVVLLGGSKDAADARSVDDVADVALDAAQDLDVDAGVDVLCEAPDPDDREALETLIDEARDRAGTDDPDIDYEITDVEGEATGTFRVTVTSDEESFDGSSGSFLVTVEQDGDRSCIAEIEPEG